MKRFITFLVLGLWLAGCDRAPTTPSSPPASQPQEIVAPPPALDANEAKFQRALMLKDQAKLVDARALLEQVIETSTPPENALDLLGEINMEILFSPFPAPAKVDYTVQSGDNLSKIATQFGTTVELIKQANGLSRDLIRVGDRLRVYQGRFAISINKTANELTLTNDGKIFKRYRVGTGEYSKTPEGEFKITNRIEDPVWYRDDGKVIPFGDPENILGTHWLGIDIPGYGIHGTWDTNTIGKQSTAGCVRLLNEDIAELYTILPVGTSVAIGK